MEYWKLRLARLMFVIAKMCNNCVCCSQCPFSHKDHTIVQAVQDKEFCLESSEQGFLLKSEHSYFYQVRIMHLLMEVKFLCNFYSCRCNVNCSVHSVHTAILLFGQMRICT